MNVVKNYKINPVKATCLKYGKNYKGIQGLNDTCFGICAAFSGTYDTYAMDPQCSKSCEDLIEKRKHELYGVGSCDHQVPYRPVFWDQVPRYVPSLLRKGETPFIARKKCREYCLSSSLKNECLEKCDLDFNAIEEEKYTNQDNNNIVNKQEKLKTEFNFKKTEKSHPIFFWGFLIFISILFIISLIYVVKKL